MIQAFWNQFQSHGCRYIHESWTVCFCIRTGIIKSIERFLCNTGQKMCEKKPYGVGRFHCQYRQHKQKKGFRQSERGMWRNIQKSIYKACQLCVCRCIIWLPYEVTSSVYFCSQTYYTSEYLIRLSIVINFTTRSKPVDFPLKIRVFWNFAIFQLLFPQVPLRIF